MTADGPSPRTDTTTVLVITPSNGGGMLHYGSQLCNGLAEHVQVRALVDEGADASLFADEVAVDAVAVPGSLGELGAGTAGFLRSVYRAAAREAVDVVHLTAMNPLFVPLFAALREKPTFVTCHDVHPHPGDEGLRATVAIEGLVRLATGVVVHGEYNRRQFRDRFGPSKPLVTIRHGSYEFFRSFCERPVEYGPELLFFGRLRPYKGVDRLLAAAPAIRERVPEFELTIAGDGPSPVADGAPPEGVTVVDEFLPEARVCELFSRCRAVVLPYREASQSGIVPIAYSFRKPVIATRVGGIPEVVETGRTGLLVSDRRELVDACVALLSDRDLAVTMGENAAEFARTEMAWSDICGHLARQYDAVGADGAGASGPK